VTFDVDLASFESFKEEWSKQQDDQTKAPSYLMRSSVDNT